MNGATGERSTHASWIVFDCRKGFPGFSLDARWESSCGVVALVGRSGSGKTMTLRCIAGLERPDQGRIRLGERVLFDSAAPVFVPAHHRRVGFVFQHYALFPHLRVRENVLFGFGAEVGPEVGPKRKDGAARAEGGWEARSGAEAREAVLRETLALCRLEGLESRYPRELSGGQRQRVAIARALASRPAALLLDEPFAALDSQTRDEVMSELRTILRRSSVPTVLVTHDAGEAAELAEDLITMEGGAARRPAA